MPINYKESKDYSDSAVATAIAIEVSNRNSAISAATAALPSPQWIKVTKTYSDFSTNGLTNDLSIYTLPTNGYIHDVKIIPRIAFSGGLIGTYTISVGKSGSLTKYAIATDVFTGNITKTSIHTPLVGLESTLSTTDIRAQAISTVANLSAATAGTVDIYLLTSTLP